ncbi:MAG: hypothetical protein HGB03_01845 [Candidatus Yonathbacteria bacterium]|nr:hypothetical protein [Candidatus Yonathbacteria bacterium]NTW48002.1 hypothetical protein [Candidatus Yonathbacteria bacterium]
MMKSLFKRYDKFIFITLAIVVVSVLAWRIPFMMKAPYEKAKVYCEGPDVAGVAYSASARTTKVLSSLIGAGATYYPEKGDAFSCPTASSEVMSDNCKAMLDVVDWVPVCDGNISDTIPPVSTPGSDPLNATYYIDDVAFSLVNGIAEQESAPGSSGRDIVSVFGVPVYGDLDDDGDDDATLFLRKTGTGSGTFYYVAVALHTSDGFIGTQGLFLGDRIAPEHISVRTGMILVNYADRGADENFSIQPSYAKTLYAQIRDGAFVAVPDLPRGAALFFGTISLGEEPTFRSCDLGEPTYRIADDSPFLSDISMMFGGEAGSVYATVSGMVMNEEVIYINSLIRLSSFASCTSDMIVLDTPGEGQRISSPLRVSGRARGMWFFEGSFPVSLTDWDGRIIAQGIAEAQGDWMTEEFVPFLATLTFETPMGGVGIPDTGSLILQKDNPSGLPENDDALEIVVRFK